ncbi:DUF4282 domain-containing protein [Leucobacter sp. cx-42]|uniref:DUF4282 domain-containing protein n=1 Tax=unclassified Leucobacter TaxID=2621730 RepID=UPI00165DF7F2|nr:MULTISPECIES: DUF4282 domain-containing protein [unclassified Leucobacter]MBC9955040.1 DUF4282 domain-containing protein [Leucobacter sp. cx-42]
MTETPHSTPPAGWHPDPAGSDQLRFWDGSAWTEQLRPARVQAEAPTQNETQVLTDVQTDATPAAPDTAANAAPHPGAASIPPAYMRPQIPNQGRFSAQFETGFFRSLFDLSFASDKVVTISIARLIYLLSVVFAGLSWIIGAIALFFMGATDYNGDVFIVWGIFQLLFGWIGSLIFVVLVRVSLEVMIALIRTSQNTAKLVHIENAKSGNQNS